MALKLTGEGTRAGVGWAWPWPGLACSLGIDLLKEGFEGLGPQALPQLDGTLPGVILAGLLGIGLTILLQASSATLTLVLTAVAGA
jgi:phosphate:Na+ symporter